MKKILLFLLFSFYYSLFVCAQDANTLIKKAKEKMDMVNDYKATAILKTDVAFIKAPASNVIIYYKKPNQFSLQKDGGISVLPKGGMSVNISDIINVKDFTALDAGEAILNNKKTKVVKLLPNDDNSNVVLSTLYIDATTYLILKDITTTKENGTYELNLSYGKYAAYGLPDKVQFSFNAKDYKLPKGITLDFNNDLSTEEKEKLKNKNGTVEITYTSYIINKGVDDAIFK
jgi:outer membrane lipoprotein-sorting protein